jgi:hypothetical protein
MSTGHAAPHSPLPLHRPRPGPAPPAVLLAGIKVLSLINEHAGAALQYEIDKDFSNASRHVIFYDMGAGSTYAALVYYSV